MGGEQNVSTNRIATIADGASLSGAIDVLGWEVVSIEQAASCEGTKFSFQGSLDGVTFVDLYDETGTEISVTKSATLAQILYLKQDIRLRGFSQIKIRSGLTGAATNQTGDASILVGLAQVG